MQRALAYLVERIKRAYWQWRLDRLMGRLEEVYYREQMTWLFEFRQNQGREPTELEYTNWILWYGDKRQRDSVMRMWNVGWVKGNRRS